MEWLTILTNGLEIAFLVVVIGGLVHRFLRDYGRHVRREFGILIDKQELPPAVESPRGKVYAPVHSQFVMKFDMQKRVFTFDASILLFDRVQVGDRGILTYRGRRLIDFDQTDAPSA